jgi:hypothetical protein
MNKLTLLVTVFIFGLTISAVREWSPLLLKSQRPQPNR